MILRLKKTYKKNWTLQRKTRSPMIDGEDEYAHNNKGDP